MRYRWAGAVLALVAAAGCSDSGDGDDKGRSDPTTTTATTTDPWCSAEAQALWPNGPDAEWSLPDQEWDAWMARNQKFTERCDAYGNLPYIDE